jgi:hypothetical protein
MEREVQRRKVGYTPSWNSHSVENKREEKKTRGKKSEHIPCRYSGSKKQSINGKV